MKLIKKLNKLGDRVGKDAQLRAFESFRLVLDSEDELTVCGCESLREMGETYLSVECADRIVEVWGKNMQIVVYDDTELRFRGLVDKIGVCRKKSCSEREERDGSDR